MTSNEWDKGEALFREIYGDGMTEGLKASIDNPDTFCPEQARWTVDFSFGAVWSREGMARKMRSCVVLGMLIGQGAEEEIKYHTRMGLKNGLTRQELEEIVYTAIPYAGFPRAGAAKRAMLAVLEE